MNDSVTVAWRRYGKGRRLRATWPGGWAEGSAGLAEEAVLELAYLKANELSLPLRDTRREVTGHE